MNWNGEFSVNEQGSSYFIVHDDIAVAEVFGKGDDSRRIAHALASHKPSHPLPAPQANAPNQAPAGTQVNAPSVFSAPTQLPIQRFSPGYSVEDGEYMSADVDGGYVRYTDALSTVAERDAALARCEELKKDLAALRNHTPLVGQEAYKVIQDNKGCITCGHDAQWGVVGPDEAMLGQTYGNEEDAQWMCDSLNRAYDEGLSSGASPAWRDCEQELPQCTNGMFLVTYLFQDKHPCQRVCAWYNGAFHDLELKALNVTHWKPLDPYPTAPASGGQHEG